MFRSFLAGFHDLEDEPDGSTPDRRMVRREERDMQSVSISPILCGAAL